MTTIAHISDLHVSRTDFDEKAFLTSVEEINALKPDMILLTGDVTDNGYYREYVRATDYLKMFNAPLFAIPGNQDSKNRGYEVFEELIGERSWRVITKDGLIVIGLDSTSPDLDSGHIGREQRIWMDHQIKKAMSDSCNFSIVALHHHVIPIPKTGRNANILIDSGDMLESVISNNINLVLTGHKHVCHVWKLENTLFVNAGTLSSCKLRGKDKNSYNTYFIDENEVKLCLNEVGGKKKVLRQFIRK